MTTQASKNLTLDPPQFNGNLKSLIQGYILNCRCEGKSEATIHHYDSSLRRFMSFHESNGGSLKVDEVTPDNIRHFLWYVTSEPVRWNGSSTTARKPATVATAENYYRTLHTFF
jgi:site-specific recombinase XerD